MSETTIAPGRSKAVHVSATREVTVACGEHEAGRCGSRGWKDVETLLMCYQHLDDETLLEVMAEPRKLREAVT